MRLIDKEEQPHDVWWLVDARGAFLFGILACRVLWKRCTGVPLAGIGDVGTLYAHVSHVGGKVEGEGQGWAERGR